MRTPLFFRRKAEKSGTNESQQPREEFEADILPHLDSLYATAFRLTRKAEDAEDLVQDAILRAYRYYDRFEAGTNLRAWLLRILVNLFLNRHRRHALERRVMEGVDSDTIGGGLMSRAAMRSLCNPAEEHYRGLIRAEIQKALDALPEEFRTVLVLADIEELSYREIANILACPLGTVMSRLHRARQAIKGHLVEQAHHWGIIAEEEAAETAAPVALETYRRRRERRGSGS